MYSGSINKVAAYKNMEYGSMASTRSIALVTSIFFLIFSFKTTQPIHPGLPFASQANFGFEKQKHVADLRSKVVAGVVVFIKVKGSMQNKRPVYVDNST